MTTYNQLRDILVHITQDAPADVFFMENSRKREGEYAERSVHRWLEIVHFLEQIAPVPRCLDIGSSPFTFALKHYCAEVETLDISEQFKLRLDRAGIKLHIGGSHWPEELLPNDSYDCIVFLEVIEHLHENPEKVLLFLQRKLRPGGWLILSTPNMMSFGNRIKMLFNMKLGHFTYPAFAGVGHHGHNHDRVYSPAEMREYFEHTKWSQIKFGYHGVAVSDSVRDYPWHKKILRSPVQVIKHLVPSTRQLVLVFAQK